MTTRIISLERLSEYNTTLYPSLDNINLSEFAGNDLRCVIFFIFCIEDKAFRKVIKQENKIDTHIEIVHEIVFREVPNACPLKFSEVYYNCGLFVKYLFQEKLF